jgi:hypothetical protein
MLKKWRRPKGGGGVVVEKREDIQYNIGVFNAI